jgi:hypothetical protein
MIMFDQSRRLSEPLRWGRRERMIVAVLASCLLVALAGLGVFALTSGSPPRKGCIEVTFASTLGGAELQGCGAKARHICASGSFHSIRDELRAACLRAGYPFKSG